MDADCDALALFEILNLYNASIIVHLNHANHIGLQLLELGVWCNHINRSALSNNLMNTSPSTLYSRVISGVNTSSPFIFMNFQVKTL
jgi:hypothetical protein